MAKNEALGVLTIDILEARQLKATDKSLSGFYVQVEIGETREFTIRKNTQADLTFNEQFIFNNASKSVPVVITVLCKNIHDTDVAIGSAVVDKAKWNGETRWIMLEDNRKAYAGQILVCVGFERGCVDLRPPFSNVAKIAEHTGNLIAPADPYIEQALDTVKKGWKSVVGSSMVSTAKTYANKLERHHILALVAANGSVLMTVGGTVLLCVTIPALLFFPITIFFSVTSAVMFAIAAMVFVPLFTLLTW
eukprot:CAMPEP_0117753094 /NCGR_PEP_ID=MMETSP0947-20121206/12014_1 /TAXON_ID=44440 /ORGANISM="Chattonella subsalsa, Strain CCMP2191" /LENGTH=248 /DNA_ID=CAMNT_0005571897 /DNA_START=266 /DNA_END=1009 /DNA_ORIENTATION=-